VRTLKKRLIAEANSKQTHHFHPTWLDNYGSGADRKEEGGKRERKENKEYL